MTAILNPREIAALCREAIAYSKSGGRHDGGLKAAALAYATATAADAPAAIPPQPLEPDEEDDELDDDDEEEIDTLNRFVVALNGVGQIVVLGSVPRLLTKEQALNLAAYLVTLGDPDGRRFRRVLRAVQRT